MAFEDIIGEEKPKSSKSLEVEINYFKDGEGFECDASITEQELLGALPAFVHFEPTEEKLNLLINKMKGLLLMEKCLHLVHNVV